MKVYELQRWYPSLPENWVEGLELEQSKELPKMYLPRDQSVVRQLIPEKELENEDYWLLKENPKLMTEDGMVIVPDQSYYIVSNNSVKLMKRSIFPPSVINNTPQIYRIFASEVNAKAWIFENCILFSHKDIKDFCRSGYHSRQLDIITNQKIKEYDQ